MIKMFLKRRMKIKISRHRILIYSEKMKQALLLREVLGLLRNMSKEKKSEVEVVVVVVARVLIVMVDRVVEKGIESGGVL